MLKEALIEIYERDLNKLKKELNLYENEAAIWVLNDEISNSAGNLTLHLIGNLNHFLGALLGNSGYVRNRALEFSSSNVSRDDLNNKIEGTIEVVRNTLEKLTDEDFENIFPEKFQEKIVKTDFMLIHLTTHLAYHLGQINYHRRLFG